MGNAPTENFPDYEVLNGLIEAAKRNQQSASDATKILRDAVEMFENKIPLPHYAVLNALIEAAKRNQRAAERATQDLSAAIMTLQGQTSNLPNTLVEPVVNKLLPKLKDEFRAMTEEAERAGCRFQRMPKYLYGSSFSSLLFASVSRSDSCAFGSTSRCREADNLSRCE